MMEDNSERVIYTDGREVTVTEERLQVRKHEYLLKGITRCALEVIRPKRAPALILLLIGLALIACGLLELVPENAIRPVSVAGMTAGANALAIWAGAALALIGTLVLGMVREKYAVRIGTAEGDKDAVVSNRREYIAQIVDAINQAVTFVRGSGGSKHFTVRSANGDSF